MKSRDSKEIFKAEIKKRLSSFLWNSEIALKVIFRVFKEQYVQNIYNMLSYIFSSCATALLIFAITFFISNSNRDKGFNNPRTSLYISPGADLVENEIDQALRINPLNWNYIKEKDN